MIYVDIEKAKNIAHDMRREKRSEEFSPYDNIIAKQIPGKSSQEAESKRQEIREKYEKIQNDINESQDIEQLKQVVLEFTNIIS